jgi:hypothetical protein
VVKGLEFVPVEPELTIDCGDTVFVVVTGVETIPLYATFTPFASIARIWAI